MCQVLRNLTVPKTATSGEFTVTSTVGAAPGTQTVEVAATSKELLNFYGSKAISAPRSLSDVPAGKVAVIDMRDYSEIHVATDQYEFDYLNKFAGTWYFIDRALLNKF